MILNSLLQNVLGYKMEEIKNEELIEGKKADYVVSVVGGDVIVIEAKRINSKLQENEEAQIITYGTQSGIKWVLLTNVISWKLYEITTTNNEKRACLVFDIIDIKDGLDEKAINYLCDCNQVKG